MLPLLTGDAVKIVVEPEQLGPVLFDVIDTAAAAFGRTEVVIEFEFTVTAHTASEVKEQVITSPLTSELVEYVGLFGAPIETPFFFQLYTGTDPPLTGAAV